MDLKWGIKGFVAEADRQLGLRVDLVLVGAPAVVDIVADGVEGTAHDFTASSYGVVQGIGFTSCARQ